MLVFVLIISNLKPPFIRSNSSSSSSNNGNPNNNNNNNTVKRVLIVDDSKTNRRVLAKMLGELWMFLCNLLKLFIGMVYEKLHTYNYIF